MPDGWMRCAASLFLCMLIVLAAGCLPTRFEDVWGYNQVELRNRGDRPIESFFVVRSDQPTRGEDYIDLDGGLLPERSVIADGLRNGTYTLEIDFFISGEEQGNPDLPPRKVTQKLPNVNLQWGETFTWHWYGPDENLIPEPLPPDEEPFNGGPVIDLEG